MKRLVAILSSINQRLIVEIGQMCEIPITDKV